MTFEDLIKAGWMEYTCSFKSADRFAQTKVKDGDTILYFINAEEYQLSKLDGKLQDSIIFTGILYQSNSDPWFEVYLNNASTLEEVYEFFSQVYQNLNCIPDIHNN